MRKDDLLKNLQLPPLVYFRAAHLISRPDSGRGPNGTTDPVWRKWIGPFLLASVDLDSHHAFANLFRSVSLQECDQPLQFIRGQNPFECRHAVPALLDHETDVGFVRRSTVEQLFPFKQAFERRPHLPLVGVYAVAATALLENVFSLRPTLTICPSLEVCYVWPQNEEDNPEQDRASH